MNNDRQKGFVARLLLSWLALTPGEHKALALLIGLFLLGVACRLWVALFGS